MFEERLGCDEILSLALDSVSVINSVLISVLSPILGSMSDSTSGIGTSVCIYRHG